jgi:hypothetical protein
MSRSSRIRDLAIETLIAVTVVTGFVVYLFESHSGKQRDWTSFVQIGNTAIVFGFLISWFRHAWRRLSFWTVIGALLFVHVAVYVFVFRHIQHLGLVYYALFDVLEIVVFTRILVNLTPSTERPAGGP